ncbi:MAG: cyclic nucleotide-binding domain-containing protein [Deltaproteobacteria bacterium]|nr:cyclic nucleotide-binding domain-containing protein [Deltaproteobacteria bacterium]
MTIVEALQKSSLFREFSETGLKIFAAIATEKSIPAGAPLFAENMVGESMFIVKSGTVRITSGDSGNDRPLAVLGAGEHVGELALLARSVRLVSAVAETPCELVEIAQRDFYRLQPQKPQACLKLALAIASDLARKMAEGSDALRTLAQPKG